MAIFWSSSLSQAYHTHMIYLVFRVLFHFQVAKTNYRNWKICLTKNTQLTEPHWLNVPKKIKMFVASRIQHLTQGSPPPCHHLSYSPSWSRALCLPCSQRSTAWKTCSFSKFRPVKFRQRNILWKLTPLWNRHSKVSARWPVEPGKGSVQGVQVPCEKPMGPSSKDLKMLRFIPKQQTLLFGGVLQKNLVILWPNFFPTKTFAYLPCRKKQNSTCSHLVAWRFIMSLSTSSLAHRLSGGDLPKWVRVTQQIGQSHLTP